MRSSSTPQASRSGPPSRSPPAKPLQRQGRDYAADAQRNLDKKGEVFAVMRVEITGVMSNDDTDKFDRELFEAQVKPSFSAEEYMTRWQKFSARIGRDLDPMRTNQAIPDAVEYAAAARGEMTANSMRKLSAYRDVEINEIVAHSWGTELIYAAILSGAILPPKKLIVVGVPDNNLEKWHLLARMTGTEVTWVRADNDVVRNAQKDAALIGLDAGLKVDFKAKWAALCEGNMPNKNICKAHGRKSKPMSVVRPKELPGFGHDRLEYYKVLKTTVLKRTYTDLRTEMNLKLAAESERVKKDALNEALVEARELVARARAQAVAAAEQRKLDQERAEEERKASEGCEWIMLGGQQVCYRRPVAVADARASVSS